MTIRSGYKTSTGIVYYLLGEGPISLANGLNSVYLNRTPVVNSSVSSTVESKYSKFDIDASGDISLGVNSPQVFQESIPCLIYSGHSTATCNVSGTQMTTTTDFFYSDMLSSAGLPGFKPKLRFQGQEAEILEITDARTATISISTSYTSVAVSFDLFTYGQVVSSGSVNIGSLFIPNKKLQLTTKVRAGLRSTEAEGIIGSSITQQNIPPGTANYENVRVNFRGGFLRQPVPTVAAGFSGASSGISPGTDLTQVDFIPDANGNDTVAVYGTKTNPWWTKDNVSTTDGFLPEAGNQATSPTIVTATGTGALGLNLGNPSEVDLLKIVISCPRGLAGVKANNGEKTDAGAAFQVFLDTKTTNTSSWVSHLVAGPTLSEVTSSEGLFAHNSGVLSRGRWPSGSIVERTTASVDFEIPITLEPYKPFTDFRLRIYKLTPDAFKVGKWTYTQETTLASVTAIIEDRLSFPYSAYATIETDSTEFQGAFPEVLFDAMGGEFDLPTNYITREEASDGVAKYTRSLSTKEDTGSYVRWDGTFRRGYSNNPVWMVKEILQNERWGAGNWTLPEDFNNYVLYSQARYCDELVPDGNGGLEPRFTAGVYLEQAQDVYKVIKDFCSLMLALPYWLDGQFVINSDKPAERVKVFSKSNIKGGVFDYEGTGVKVRPNQIAVSYRNNENFSEEEVELVEDVDNIIETGRLVVDDVVAFGATTRGQARRFGLWKLLTAKLQKEIISFSTTDEASFLKPGDIIGIQDADRFAVRNSGKIKTVTNASTLVLDSSVPFNSLYDSFIHVLVPGPAIILNQASATIDGTNYVYGQAISGLPSLDEATASAIYDDSGNIVSAQFAEHQYLETRQINHSGQATDTIVVTEAFNSLPEADTIWAITDRQDGVVVSGSPRDFKILSIIEEDNDTYSIVASEHINSKFDLIDESFAFDDTKRVPRTRTMPAPKNLTTEVEFLSSSSSNGSSSSDTANLLISWEAPKYLQNGVFTKVDDIDYYVVKVSDPNGNLTTYETSGLSYLLTNIKEGSYGVSVQAKSKLGPISRPNRALSLVEFKGVAPGLPIQNSLPRGGSFSRPIKFTSTGIVAPSSYTFQGPSGVSKIVS